MILSKKLILGSNSPRRKEILSQAGFDFEVEVRETNEDFSSELDLDKVPEFLALNKALEFQDDINGRLILTADTVVISENRILNKPQNYQEAVEMLELLSNSEHKVVTGVCILGDEIQKVFSDIALVKFNKLSHQEIDYYIRTCKPFDKAGSYGVQDFIGMIGIPKINGSFYTVMGLPIHLIYKNLSQYIDFK